MYIDKYEDLMNIINNQYLIKFEGSNSKLIVYYEHLIKFEKLLYTCLNEPNFNEKKLLNFLSSSIYCDYFKPSEDLIEYYNLVRNNIKLTKLPDSLFYYRKYPLGIILPYHVNYKNLLEFNEFSKIEIYRIIKLLLEALHELEDNGIYQLDLNYGKNVLYNNNDVQIVDLDGPYIKIHDQGYSKEMYEQFYFTLINLLTMCSNHELNEFRNDIIKENTNNYENSNLLVKELKKVL